MNGRLLRWEFKTPLAGSPVGTIDLLDHDHRKHQINPGGFQAEKVVHHLADAEIAFSVALQDGVVPAGHAFAFGNGPELVARLIGKPFDLFHHDVFQGGIIRQ